MLLPLIRCASDHAGVTESAFIFVTTSKLQHVVERHHSIMVNSVSIYSGKCLEKGVRSLLSHKLIMPEPAVAEER